MSSTAQNETLIYCCATSPIEEATKTEDAGDVDVIRLNAALHELGMLSAITNSRAEYLEEKAAPSTRKLAHLKRTECTSVCLKKRYCVLHMNSNYVTNFASSWKCGLTPTSRKVIQSHINVNINPKNDLNTSTLGILSIQQKEVKPRLNRFKLRFHRPYEFPWMHRLESRGLSSHCCNPSNEVSSSDGGNRSNPGSPEKLTIDTSTNLVRSRSLDDIEAINLSVLIPDNDLNCPTSDVETVSQKMEHLKVI